MKKTRSFRSQAYKLSTRVAAGIGIAGALACFIVVAVGGVFPTYKHGTSIVVPTAGTTWQVGELHTVQWTLNGLRTTNDKGENVTARFILSYSGGDVNGHVLLGELTDWFPIADKFANIMVPSVPTRDDYSLYMFSRDDRDVSSWSASISIFNPDDVDGKQDPPTSLDVTTAPPISVTRSLTSTFTESTSASGSALLPSSSVVGDRTSALSLPLPPVSATTTASSASATATASSISAPTTTAPAFEPGSVSTSAQTSSTTKGTSPTSSEAGPTAMPSGMATAQSVQTTSAASNRMKRERHHLRNDRKQVH